MPRAKRNKAQRATRVHDRKAQDLPLNAEVADVEVDDPLALEPGEKIVTLRSIRNDPLARDVEKLDVDGEWDMPDFGEFYSRYSDVYYFLSTTNTFTDESRPIEKRKKIKETFTTTPFRGGFSYVNFYSGLPVALSRQERLRMDKIKYESPGYVDVHGDGDTFSETEALVRSFLDNRVQLREMYNRLHEYLSKNNYLVMAGQNFLPNDPAATFIDHHATQIAEVLGLPNIDTVKSLVENNSLVFAKIILSLYRRIKETAQFFAQGRMNFTKGRHSP
jgi:hypothetical protein